MSIKNIPIYVCDNCGKEMKTPVVATEDMPNEGSSIIRYKGKEFYVDCCHYCTLKCLFKHIEIVLTGKK